MGMNVKGPTQHRIISKALTYYYKNNKFGMSKFEEEMVFLLIGRAELALIRLKRKKK